ncbi:MAG: AAA family ATPase, partial [Bacteroidetes bacterium]|nr:AAA family ATPase [Bacteroidota bacterium]
MQIISIEIHNFRSIEHSSLNIGDYSLFIGANNSGKSNVFDAIRIFYEHGIKYEHNNDFTKFETKDKECWIEIEFQLSKNEYENLKEEWRLPNNRLKVRKNLETIQKGADGKTKIGIYAYNQQGDIADELFYGAKNVQQGKLGNIIYIPAASKLDEHTKLTGPSALRELLNDILKKLVKTSDSFQTLTSEFETFSNNIKTEVTDENKSLTGLENDISAEIEEWGASFELNINSVTEADIVKNLISYKIIDKVLDERMEASQFGQGFQRHLIFTLIRTAANYQIVAPETKKKEFRPELTVLLFEEPEAFLHPIQQKILSTSLKTIGSTEGHQSIISSHSPYFVSHNTDDLPSIIRLERKSDRTHTGQLNDDSLDEIFAENQIINTLLEDTRFRADLDDWKIEMEIIKYFLWLDPERCGMFFARQVLLVEGTTEQVLFNYLFDTGQIKMPNGGVFVLDSLGKFNIHRFMN